MTEVKVNKAVWDKFSLENQEKAVNLLKKQGILDTDDIVVGVDGEQDASALLANVEDCTDGCIPVADAAFVACMQKPGATKRECFRARANAFYACINDCQQG